MSEPQPPIPAEDLERMERNAKEYADHKYTPKVSVFVQIQYLLGAKAEHCHLRERIASLEEENKKLKETVEKLSDALELSGGFDVGFEYGAEASGRKELEEENKRLSKQLEEKDREIARLKARLRRSTMEDDDVRENEYY